MSTSGDSLKQLVEALFDGTQADSVIWEPADSRSRAFIAKGADGTVTIAGIPTDTVIGPIATVTLIVKNDAGRTIEQYDTPAPPAMGALAQAMVMPSNSIESKVRALYEVAKEQSTRAKATMESLANEFSPE